MSFKISTLRNEDHKKAIDFAITGMHFGWYISQDVLLRAYGTYFFYDELLKATQVIAAYEDERLVGVLLARMDGEERVYTSLRWRIYVATLNLLMRIFSTGEVAYDQANKKMLSSYRRRVTPDGELVFLAADPENPVKGVGTRLLDEFEKRSAGKTLYLFTDDACAYQFYDKRGFERVEERQISIENKNQKIQLRCMLYTKDIPA